MQITITGQHIEVTPAIKQSIEEKLQMLKRHYDKITSIHVVFKVEKIQQIAEATMHLARHGEIFASAAEEDLYTAIDRLIDKLKRQVDKFKEKDSNHRD